MTQSSLRAFPVSGARTFPRIALTGGHDGDGSVTGVHTALLTLTPAFHDALRKVAPKKTRSKIPYVVALAILTVLAVLGADVSAREFGTAKASQIVARFHSTPAAAPVAQVAAVAKAVTPVAAAPQPGAAPVVNLDEPAAAPVVVTVAAAKKSKKPSRPAHSKMPRSRRPAVLQPGQHHTAMLTAQISTRDW